MRGGRRHDRALWLLQRARRSRTTCSLVGIIVGLARRTTRWCRRCATCGARRRRRQIGQYLQPSPQHAAIDAGIPTSSAGCASGRGARLRPVFGLVRSSTRGRAAARPLPEGRAVSLAAEARGHRVTVPLPKTVVVLAALTRRLVVQEVEAARRARARARRGAADCSAAARRGRVMSRAERREVTERLTMSAATRPRSALPSRCPPYTRTARRRPSSEAAPGRRNVSSTTGRRSTVHRRRRSGRQSSNSASPPGAETSVADPVVGVERLGVGVTRRGNPDTPAPGPYRRRRRRQHS